MAFSGTLLGAKKSTLYQIVKYSIYLLILYNVFYFTFEDYMASEHRFRDGVAWSQFTDAFAQAVDSFAWLILLVMLELETWVIDDDTYQGGIKWVINGVSFVCYIFIFLAFLGYVEKLSFVMAFQPSEIDTACEAVGDFLSYATDIDEFVALTIQSCAEIGSSPLFVNSKAGIIATAETYNDMIILGYTEVINAGTWLLIVILLWIDVYMQMHRIQSKKYHTASTWIKVLLYGTLIAAAIVWGISGVLIDFWDAFLWIVAFFFIELNIFQWTEENTTQASSTQQAIHTEERNQP